MIEHFTVRRNNPTQHRWSTSPLPSLGEGEVLLAVDSFSFTANNVTYAMFGERMKYWEFFPTDDTAYGTIPVWGFADVVASSAEGVSVGERFYGYYPMSTHLVVKASRVSAHGFTDAAPHRAELPIIYNQYIRSSSDSMYRKDREGEIAILRPLFATSFLLEDFLADNAFFGAAQVLLSSASSKTAYGTASCLAHRDHGPSVVGLTSTANAEFVRSLGCYSNVISYEDLATLDANVPTIYCDFAGNADLRAKIHTHFGDALKYSCSIGGTHWDHLGGTRDLPGPRPTLFFAPSQAKKRVGEWGPAEFQTQLTGAWDRFMTNVSAPSTPWLNVVTSTGQDAIASTVASVIKGGVAPRDGHVLRFA
ncbi:MAG: DUF2855 family protein [Burkholderiales bacterium]|nr:MAG: DUF2855 family protein [Burkholderiales bacterium]TAG84493.1 MAG: DUF2855 family protein [Betaproteobacteria bacterium]